MYTFILTVLCVVLVFLAAFSYKEKKMNGIFLNSIDTPSNVNCPINKTLAKEGLDYFKTKKVIITGLLRNSSDTISVIKHNVTRISKLFKDYKVLVVENDSTDDTRARLLNWADENDKVTILGCGVNVETCKLNLPKTGVKTKNDDKRIKKMIMIRNVYIDYINNNYEQFNDFEYVICIDMDIKGTVYNDGMGISGYHFKTKPELDGMCANGIHVFNMGFFNVSTYHDTYAHKDENDNKKIMKFDPIPDNFLNIGLNFSISVQKCNTKNELIPVRSCFNGFMIYRLSALKNNKYELTLDAYSNETECEHVQFNRNLKHVYLNPFLIFVILKNK